MRKPFTICVLLIATALTVSCQQEREVGLPDDALPKGPKNSKLFDKISPAKRIEIKDHAREGEFLYDLPLEKLEVLRKAFEYSYVAPNEAKWVVRGYMECELPDQTKSIMLSTIGQVKVDGEYWHGVDTPAIEKLLAELRAAKK
jgi:hypothetical protein